MLGVELELEHVARRVWRKSKQRSDETRLIGTVKKGREVVLFALISAVQYFDHSSSSCCTLRNRSLRLMSGVLSGPSALSEFDLSRMSYLDMILFLCTAPIILGSYGVARGDRCQLPLLRIVESSGMMVGLETCPHPAKRRSLLKAENQVRRRFRLPTSSRCGWGWPRSRSIASRQAMPRRT